MYHQTSSDNASRGEMLQLLRMQQRLPVLPASFGRQPVYARQQNLQSNHLLQIQPLTSLCLAAALDPGWLSRGLSLAPTFPHQLGSSLALPESCLRQLPQPFLHLQLREQIARQMIRSDQLKRDEANFPAITQQQTVHSNTTTTDIHVEVGVSGKRDPASTFVSRLHAILGNPEYAACISWLPHGRAWIILDKLQFEADVIPSHFRHARYASFMRQVSLAFSTTQIVMFFSINNCTQCFFFFSGRSIKLPCLSHPSPLSHEIP